MSDIFISYKREDVPLARSLAELLTKQGWTVWWDHNIPAGKDYDTVIEQELDKCKCAIVLWTAGSIQSRNVKDEANVGLTHNKLVPVIVGEVQPPLGFRMVQGIKWNDDDTIEETEADELIYNVKQIINGGKVEPRPLYKGLNKKPFKKGILWATIAIAAVILIYLLTSPEPPDNTEVQHDKSAQQYFEIGASLADNQKDFDGAIDNFNHAIQQDSNMAAAYYGRGTAYNLKGLNSDAIQDLEKSLALGMYHAAGNLAWVYFDIGDYPKAIEYFNEHAAAQPNALSEAGAAMSFFILGNRDSAMERYSRAITMDARYDGNFEALDSEINFNDRQMRTLKNTYTALFAE